jgi:hypothetical protein
MLKNNPTIYLLGFFLLISQLLFAQEAVVFGLLKDEKQGVIEGVSIEYMQYGAISKLDGTYSLVVPANKEVELVFSHLGYVNQVHRITLKEGEQKELNLVFKAEVTVISEVELIDDAKREQNITTIDKKNLEVITGPTGGVEGLISTLAGVTTKNELSSQYSVRGGNFDENLVYVNGFEIYRPFLVRSGEQEGLSFVNSDMVENISFSSGGFQAKFGDKLSSVLDIEYKDPKEWKSHLTLSFLGVNATVEGVSKSKRWSHVTSYRQKTNQFLLNSLDTKSNYRPRFNDFQSLNIYHFTPQIKLSVLAHYSSNAYHSIPESRQSDFGTIDKPLRLNVYFDGQEQDAYNSGMGAARFDYQVHDSLKMSLSASIFQTIEQEFYDVEAQYFLGALDNSLGSDNFGEVVANRGVGGFLRHARNELFAQVYNTQYRGKWYRNNSSLEWGLKYQHELIDDQLKEWQMIDSSGFSMPQGVDSLLEMFEYVQAENEISSSRVSGYVQQSGHVSIDSTSLSYNAGVRAQYWSMNGELFVSPRLGISYQPNWVKDVLFRLAIGSYNQSPFYRELRDQEGELYTNLKSQKSRHFVLSTDYNFKSWNRPFKFVGEVYYKSLKDIIPYEMDNLRIRYLPNLTAVGYTAGVDLRVNGEFVPGVESWASLSLMNSQEDIEGDGYGYIPRPTDQRFNFSLFFQDYFPKNPSYKMNLKLHYSSGLPIGAVNSERHEQTIRIPAYRRVDIGFSKVLKDGKNGSKWKYFEHFESIWVSAEVFNLLGIRNTISYLWVTDVVQNQYAVPNYLTSRLLNLKVQAKF